MGYCGVAAKAAVAPAVPGFPPVVGMGRVGVYPDENLSVPELHAQAGEGNHHWSLQAGSYLGAEGSARWLSLLLACQRHDGG